MEMDHVTVSAKAQAGVGLNVDANGSHDFCESQTSWDASGGGSASIGVLAVVKIKSPWEGLVIHGEAGGSTGVSLQNINAVPGTLTVTATYDGISFTMLIKVRAFNFVDIDMGFLVNYLAGASDPYNVSLPF